ncbi:DNA-protecting protein DprA [Candidatus Gottesmanbacteria bacterium]|nr:DNA-protecting protein DprA [Candidatus Gottesmanbacteria bacterium]
MEDRVYYLGFSAFPGIGPLRFKLLVKFFGSAKASWNASYKDLVKINLGEKLAARFIQFRDDFSLSLYISKLKDKEIKFITLFDDNYPKLLKQISDAPIVIYMRGNLPDEVRPRIGVVGTRRITIYGRDVTEKLTAELVGAGFIIVSGMAYGVDTKAHETAIENDGKTIAVLGCGVDIIHPRSNFNLYWQIVKKHGAVISEFPPGMMANVGLFPARNRIISGLSLGVLVTEGAEDSGSLITASYGAEQGREVFAIPGPINSNLSRGPTKLLKAGAKLVTEVGDILEELKIKPISQIRQISQIGNLTKDEEKILELLQNESLHFDAIIAKAKIDATKLASILSMMELKNIIKNSGEGNYNLTEIVK